MFCLRFASTKYSFLLKIIINMVRFCTYIFVRCATLAVNWVAERETGVAACADGEAENTPKMLD